MKRIFGMIVLVVMMSLTAIPVASAHVHGITPLTCDGIGNENSGASATESTPAWHTNGGPLSGLIPRDVGNAPLTIGDGGFRPDNNPHCAP